MLALSLQRARIFGVVVAPGKRMMIAVVMQPDAMEIDTVQIEDVALRG